MPNNLMTLVPRWLRSGLGLQELQLPNLLVSPEIQGTVEIFDLFTSPLARWENRTGICLAGGTQIIVPDTAEGEQAIVPFMCFQNATGVNAIASMWICPPGFAAGALPSIKLADTTVNAGTSVSWNVIAPGGQMIWIPPLPGWALEYTTFGSDVIYQALTAYLPSGRYPR